MGIAFDPDFHHLYLAAEGVGVPAHSLLAGSIIKVAHGWSTVHPEMDFETYSEAGYVYDAEAGRFFGYSPNNKGLSAVGAAVYAEHPSCEVLKLAYNLKDGLGARLWSPGDALPYDLFAHIERGGLIEAHNSGFEFFIWQYVCHQRWGWPVLPLHQLRCSMSKAAAFALPQKLEKLTAAIGSEVPKDTEGAAIMMKVSVPRTPTKNNPSLRFTPQSDPVMFQRLGTYCVNDTYSESDVSARLPDLSPDELDLWLLDQRINTRGAHIDHKALDDCIAIVEQAFNQYEVELRHITQGVVQSAAELDVIKALLTARGVRGVTSLDKDHRPKLLARDDLPADCRRVLEIVDMLSASSVKKVFSLLRHTNKDDRVRGLFAFCGADRTGRFAGRGPQPQNLPSSGPKLHQCDPINGCGHHYKAELIWCPWCGADASFAKPDVEWNPVAVEQAFKVIASRRLDYVEHYYGDAVEIVSACLRGLYTASDGYDLICSDFSAIEAVVAAELAGETWRQEVFRTHGKIYEMGASKISGVPFEEILEHKKRTGDHHPLRKKIGKVSELASAYGGWITAWKNFGADKFMTDAEIKAGILAWRAASPMIEEMWGGQWRKHPTKWEWTPELFGLEGAAVSAIMSPGRAFAYRSISYVVHDDVLYCKLPSGRLLSYHQPRLYQTTAPHKHDVWQITYMGMNDTNQWVRLDTYGGKLFENVVQAVARDILTFAMRNLERAGYWIVLHVHDEIVSEILKGWGSIEEFERIMSTMPPWAAGWPVKAAGGWRGHRYRKE